MPDPIRYVPEIGMYAFSRGRATCHWRTPWCKRYCYNRKFYQVNPRLEAHDKKDDVFWQAYSPESFVRALPSKPPRFRFAVRGEIWICRRDVKMVAGILRLMPETLFWIPTRAWSVQGMKELIEEFITPLPNARVVCSIDPTVSEYTAGALARQGYSTIFSGDNSDPQQLQLLTEHGLSYWCDERRTARMVRCRKTWEHIRGYCAKCEDGCFSKDRVDVHLRQHR